MGRKTGWYETVRDHKGFCAIDVGTDKGHLRTSVRSARALLKHRGAKPWIDWAKRQGAKSVYSVDVECRHAGRHGATEPIVHWDRWSGGKLGRARHRRR